MSNLAVIPARGGSKRIPRKNVRAFAGKPMLAWSIEAALTSRLFSRVLVTTDDPEIAEVARAHGAEVPFARPPELSDDHTGTLEVIHHAARWAAADGGSYDAVCCIYATAPFVSASDLTRARAALDDARWDYVFPAGRYAYPVQRSFLRADDKSMSLLFPEHRTTRSQDLPPVFHDAGQFYWGRFEAWTSGAAIFGPRTTFIELPPWRVQDIDTEDDWRMAEYLFAASRTE